MLAIVGIAFGALVPLANWLDPGKTAVWVGGGLLFAVGAAVLCRRRFLVAYSSAFLVRVGVFAGFWVTLPLLLCTWVFVFGDRSKDCLCNDYSTVNIEVARRGALIALADGDQVRELIDRSRSGVASSVVVRHLPDVVRVIDSVDKRAVINEEAADFMEYWRREEGAITIAALRMASAFSSSPLAPSRQAEAYRNGILFQIRNSSGIVFSTD